MAIYFDCHSKQQFKSTNTKKKRLLFRCSEAKRLNAQATGTYDK